MKDYALVLNAGSSSLKFCVYQRPEKEGWRLESRGQIEGIGTSPRIVARNAEERTLIDQNLDSDVRDGRDALGALSAWLTSTYREARVLLHPSSSKADRDSSRNIQAGDNRQAGPADAPRS